MNVKSSKCLNVMIFKLYKFCYVNPFDTVCRIWNVLMQIRIPLFTLMRNRFRLRIHIFNKEEKKKTCFHV